MRTQAFEHFIAALEQRAPLRARVEALASDDLDAIAAVSQELRARIEAAALPQDLQQEILAAHALLGGAGPAPIVAVRSSATTEDAADASFAGLQDTYLWVMQPDDVLHKIRSCWASLYSVESVSYRRRQGMPESAVAMAVVVQTMVDARTAGVMFTRSPTTGDRSVITIEGAWGLGSAVVGGEVTPDRWVVGKITGEIPVRDISDKAIRHAPAPTGGVVDVPVDDRPAPCGLRLGRGTAGAARDRPQGRASLRAAAGHRVGHRPAYEPPPAAAEPAGDGVVEQGGDACCDPGRRSAAACHVDFRGTQVSLTAADVAGDHAAPRGIAVRRARARDRRHEAAAAARLGRRAGGARCGRSARSGIGTARLRRRRPCPPPRVRRAAGQDVTSPMLGTFYRAPKPGAPPFVEVGAPVEADTVIGIIEVMKLMNTVRAGLRGRVSEILRERRRPRGVR